MTSDDVGMSLEVIWCLEDSEDVATSLDHLFMVKPIINLGRL